MENLLKKTSLSSPVNRKALELLEKGLVELDYKRLEAAKLNFQTAIELEPEFAVAYFYLGSVLFEQDLLTEAMAAFEKALSIDPHNEDLRELINELRDLTSYP